MGPHLVQLHGTEHGPHVGHGEVANGAGQVVDLIGPFAGIHHLHEADGVYGDVGVVPGDHLLGRDVQHLLHHDDLVADPVHIGDQQVEARGEGAGVAAETLHGPVIALGHYLDACPQGGYHQENENP